MRRVLGDRLVFALALALLAFVGAYVLTALAPGDAVVAIVKATAIQAVPRTSAP